jgi:carbamate kinase
MDTLVVALGGNALLQRGETPSFAVQLQNVQRTAAHLGKVFAKAKGGFAITHGNGPQVGDEFLRNLYAGKKVSRLPLAALNGETQALIGSMLELSVGKELRRLGSRKEVSAMLTHVLVSKGDAAFSRPTKQIGPFYPKKELIAEEKKEGFGYVRAGAGFRRVVPSPAPLGILEIKEIKSLLKGGNGVVCCGGGGIPVFRSGAGYSYANAVIDKDRTTQLLANSLGAKRMVILMDTDYVYRDAANKKHPIRKARAEELEEIVNTFEEGTMRPKVEACLKFLENGGERAQIGSLWDFERVMEGRSGTDITG